MRQKRTAQQSLFDPEPVHHPVADALEALSQLCAVVYETPAPCPGPECTI